MGSDELLIALDRNFDQVIPASALGRALSYVGAAIGILAGPAMMMMMMWAVGAFEWPSLVGGVAILLTLGLFSLAWMISTVGMHRRVQRLRRDGTPAFHVAHRGSHGAIDQLCPRFPVVVDLQKKTSMVLVR